MLYNTNHQTFDGKNTVSVSPDVTPGETHFYSTQLYKRMEFDMKLNSLAYITPETLYLSLLHEFGHVYGLDHPDKPHVDTERCDCVIQTRVFVSINICFSENAFELAFT